MKNSHLKQTDYSPDFILREMQGDDGYYYGCRDICRVDVPMACSHYIDDNMRSFGFDAMAIGEKSLDSCIIDRAKKLAFLALDSYDAYMWFGITDVSFQTTPSTRALQILDDSGRLVEVRDISKAEHFTLDVGEDQIKYLERFDTIRRCTALDLMQRDLDKYYDTHPGQSAFSTMYFNLPMSSGHDIVTMFDKYDWDMFGRFFNIDFSDINKEYHRVYKELDILACNGSYDLPYASPIALFYAAVMVSKNYQGMEKLANFNIPAERIELIQNVFDTNGCAEDLCRFINEALSDIDAQDEAIYLAQQKVKQTIYDSIRVGSEMVKVLSVLESMVCFGIHWLVSPDAVAKEFRAGFNDVFHFCYKYGHALVYDYNILGPQNFRFLDRPVASCMKCGLNSFCCEVVQVVEQTGYLCEKHLNTDVNELMFTCGTRVCKYSDCVNHRFYGMTNSRYLTTSQFGDLNKIQAEKYAALGYERNQAKAIAHYKTEMITEK